MKFEAVGINAAFRVRIEPLRDARGFFARAYCAGEFLAAGLPEPVVQANLSFNERRGTVRGLHFQWPPSREGKLVRCVKGALLDVLLDLRPDSATYLSHVSIRLDDETRDAVFVPHGVAHGFQTLTDAAEVLYLMTDVYAPDLAAGVRWDDPAFGIEWPVREGFVISDRDGGYPDFDRKAFETELERHSRRET